MPINTSELTAQQQITAIYVAYYDRAPDPAGLQFWTDQLQGGRSLDQIATDFSGAAETKEKYPFFDAPNVASADTFITSIYVNLFGRTPDDAGRDFWSEQLESGSTDVGEIILAILEGAQDEASGGFPDSETVTNKIDVGLDWAQSAIEAGIGLSNNPIAEEIDGQVVVNNQAAFDSATSILDGVDGTPQSVTDAKAATDAFIASGGGVSEVFTLTSDVDDLTGTPGNDVFNAPLGQTTDLFGTPVVFQTLTAVDEIDGEEGTDRLNARLIDGSASGVLIDNVENLFLRSSDDSAALNMSGVTGAEQVWSDRSTGNLTISAIQTGVVLGVTQGNGSDYTAAYADDANGADFTQTVALQDADIGTLTVTEGGGADDEITGLAFNVTGSDVELTLAGDLPGVTDLAIEGDAGLDLSSTPLDDLETIDSTTTGDVSVVAGDVLETASFGEGNDTLETGGLAVETISMGAGDDEVTVTSELVDGAAIDLGEGDDRLVLDNNLDTTKTNGVLDTTVSLNGGAGTNTLAMDSATAAAVSTDDAGFDTQIENFQKLELGPVANSETPTVDLSNMDNIDEVITSGVDAGVVNSVAEPEVHEFTVASGTDADGGSFFLNGVEIAVAGGDDATAVATAITDAFDNGDFAGVPEIDSISNTGAAVTVTYTEAAGNVADDFLVFEENPDSSAVTFSSNSIDAGGTAPVQEVQSFDVVSGTDADGGTATITDGVATNSISLQGNLTQSEVATAIANNLSTSIRVDTATASGSTITVTYFASEDDIGGLAGFTDVDSGASDGNNSEDTKGVAPVDATQSFNIDTGTDADGGNILVAGVSIALGANLSVDQVGVAITDAFANGDFAGTDVTDVAYDTANDEVTLTLDAANAVYTTELDVSDDPATSNVDLDLGNVAPTQFVPEDADPDGVLTLDNMQSGGTVELTDEVNGSLVVNVDGAVNSNNDVVNLRLNPVNNLLLQTGVVQIADVETVNIETTNSGENNPTDFSDLGLDASSAETVTVSGNQGIWVNDFGGDLSSMTLFDASGVQAVESAPGNDDAGDIGFVRIETGATDADVTILTGNGDDFIDASFVGTDPADTGSAATIESGAGDDAVIGSQGDDIIETGAGDDFVTGSLGDDSIDLGDGVDTFISAGGADTITLGAGNDTYELLAAQDSVINNRDEITDFSPNTVGQGSGGAVTDAGAAASVDDRDGDVIDLSGFGGAPLSVAVFANASNATTFLANNDNDGEMNIALDSSTGFLYIDTGDDGIANSVIELTGVTTIDEAAFVI